MQNRLRSGLVVTYLESRNGHTFVVLCEPRYCAAATAKVRQWERDAEMALGHRDGKRLRKLIREACLT